MRYLSRLGEEPTSANCVVDRTAACVRRFRGINCFTLAAKLSLHPADASQSLSWQRRDTILVSSSRSATRKRARPCPITTSGSGVTASVHCGGTEQTMVSSTCSNSRLPERLYRSPTQRSCRPPNGWNGCVIRTSWVGAAGRFAFRDELQAAGARPVCLAVAGRRDRRDQRVAAGLYARWDRLEKPGSHLASGGRRLRAPPRSNSGCGELTHPMVEDAGGSRM